METGPKDVQMQKLPQNTRKETAKCIYPLLALLSFLVNNTEQFSLIRNYCYWDDFTFMEYSF